QAGQYENRIINSSNYLERKENEMKKLKKKLKIFDSDGSKSHDTFNYKEAEQSVQLCTLQMDKCFASLLKMKQENVTNWILTTNQLDIHAMHLHALIIDIQKNQKNFLQPIYSSQNSESIESLIQLDNNKFPFQLDNGCVFCMNFEDNL